MGKQSTVVAPGLRHTATTQVLDLEYRMLSVRLPNQKGEEEKGEKVKERGKQRKETKERGKEKIKREVKG